jgi:hypothetical protein
MTKLSHREARLSMLAAAAGIAAVGSTGVLAKTQNVYLGRWTVYDDRPSFSSRGLTYKTIDIVPCGNDHCGVSVGKNGACGPTLFRFQVKPVDGDDGLSGRGRWGKETKNIEIYADRNDNEKAGRLLNLYLGDGHSFAKRSGSMATYTAFYKPKGAAHCAAH